MTLVPQKPQAAGAASPSEVGFCMLHLSQRSNEVLQCLLALCSHASFACCSICYLPGFLAYNIIRMPAGASSGSGGSANVILSRAAYALQAAPTFLQPR